MDEKLVLVSNALSVSEPTQSSSATATISVVVCLAALLAGVWWLVNAFAADLVIRLLG